MLRQHLTRPRHARCRLPAAAVLAACLAVACGTQGLAQSDAPSPPSAAALPADPDCLTVTQSSPSTYMIANSACPEQSVLSAIELAAGGSLARCFVKKIRTQISIASEGTPPVINYQCIEGAKGCSSEVVRDMFPECHAG